MTIERRLDVSTAMLWGSCGGVAPAFDVSLIFAPSWFRLYGSSARRHNQEAGLIGDRAHPIEGATAIRAVLMRREHGRLGGEAETRTDAAVPRQVPACNPA